MSEESLELTSNPAKHWTQAEALVLSGGGALGVAYAGAIAELDKQLKKKGFIEGIHKIKTFVGSSAGALTAMLLAVGWEPDDIKAIMLDIQFPLWLNCGHDVQLPEILAGKPYREITASQAMALFEKLFLEKFYLCDMSPAYEHIENKISDRLGSHFNQVTFEQLFNHKKTTLITTCCNLNTNRSLVFSPTNAYKHLKVVDAVYASMAIPILFQPNSKHDFLGEGIKAVDGGLTNNYPVLVKELGGTPWLGLTLMPQGCIEIPPVHAVNSFISTLMNMIGTSMFTKYEEIFGGENRVKNEAATIFIAPDSRKWGPLDFTLSKDQIRELFSVGEYCVQRYIEKYPDAPDA